MKNCVTRLWVAFVTALSELCSAQRSLMLLPCFFLINRLFYWAFLCHSTGWSSYCIPCRMSFSWIESVFILSCEWTGRRVKALLHALSQCLSTSCRGLEPCGSAGSWGVPLVPTDSSFPHCLWVSAPPPVSPMLAVWSGPPPLCLCGTNITQGSSSWTQHLASLWGQREVGE